jgi:ABC-type transporter Mla subunit MlaD
MTKTIKALQAASKMGVISITPQTATIIEALAQLNEAADNLTATFEDNAPEMLSDIKELDATTDALYQLYEPFQTKAYETAGRLIFTEMFSTTKFKGL